MQVIILAAGRGTRFGELTKVSPKSLIPVHGKPILEYILSSLPPQTKEVFIVIGHLGEKIKKHFGNTHNGRKINYINIAKLNGTGGALWQAKQFLKKDRFLILNGDDIYYKNELSKLIGQKYWSAGLAKIIPQSQKYLTFNLDKNGRITGAHYPTEKEARDGILISTGAFVIDHNIFKYKLVPIAQGREFGLPQTILKAIKKYPLKGIIMEKWFQINRPEDVKNSERALVK